MPVAKKLLRLVRFILFVLCISIVSLEFTGRLFLKQPYYAFPRDYFKKNEFYGYELAPHFKGTYSQPEFSISINTNSQGMRDNEHPASAGEYRVLVLGDSSSFGIGVELKDTYLSLLEEMLNARGGRKISILKAGVPGYSAYNEKIYLEKKGIRYQPSLVMVQFWWDDLGVNHLTYQTEAGFLVSGRIATLVELRAFLNSRFRSYGMLRRIFASVFHRSLFSTGVIDPNENPGRLRERFVSTLKEFKEIEKTCSQQKIKCLFVLMPSREFIYGSAAQKQMWQTWQAYLAGSGVDFIDLAPAMEQAVCAGKNIFFHIDPHLTVVGNNIVARALSERLRKMEIAK